MITPRRIIKTLAKEVRIPVVIIPKRALVLQLAVLLMLACFLYVYNRSLTYVVYLNDVEIGVVTSDKALLDYVAFLQEEKAAALGLEVSQLQELRVVRERRQGAQEDDGTVKDKLQRKLQYDVYAYMIYVNDKPTLAVRTYDDYRQVLEILKKSYTSGRAGAVVQDIVLEDRVEAKQVLVNPGMMYSADRAAEILRRGTDRRETYLVSRGDSLWTIARRKGLTIEEIQAANPQLEEPDSLQVGDQIDLVVPQPLVGVSVTEDVTVMERIPFETVYRDDGRLYRGTSRVLTPGKYGQKEVTYRISRANDREVRRETVSERVVTEPQDQVVARGTAAVPVLGRGPFLWPVPDSFRITSKFGPRGRSFHTGVDIGVDSGSTVLAADDGTVVFAGWAGAFGILVSVDHGNGYVTKYAHNSRVLVSEGQRVERGQQIARSGNTGNSTGPHVHFEIVRHGAPLNPMRYF
jgi:murein DD-endopeptidase MepM/ murein hydrolase activator NlpD